MVYKVKVVTKDNISEIRYITASDVVSNNINVLAEVDAIRDIANNIMSKQPSVNYADATNLAKEIRYGLIEEKTSEQPVLEDKFILPGVEMDQVLEENLFNLEPVKQKVLKKVS